MDRKPDKEEDRKTEIAAQIADLSMLLGMMPSDGTIKIQGPLSKNAMVLSEWLDAARKSFLKLSLLIGKELDIQLQ